MPDPISNFGWKTRERQTKALLPVSHDTQVELYRVVNDGSNNGTYYWDGAAYAKYDISGNINGLPAPYPL